MAPTVLVERLALKNTRREILCSSINHISRSQLKSQHGVDSCNV